MTGLAFSASGPLTPPAPSVLNLDQIVGVLPAKANYIYGGIGYIGNGIGNPKSYFPWVDFTDTGKWDNNSKVTVTKGATAPDGMQTAQIITPTAVSGNHFTSVNGGTAGFVVGTVTPISYRYAIIAKQNGYTRLVLDTGSDTLGGVKDVSIGFDLAGGNTNYDNSVGSDLTLVTAAMTSLPNGYWLCYFDFFVNTSGLVYGSDHLQYLPGVYVDNGSGTAARSISFTGDGVKAINVWWINFLPTAMWGAITQKFFDDFNSLATIDVNDSLAPNLNWYVHNLWPNTKYTTFGWATNPPSAPTPSSAISQVKPSCVQIFNPTDTQGFLGQLWSVGYAGGSNFVGNAWTGSTFREMVAQTYFAPPSFASPGKPNGSDVTTTNGIVLWYSPVEALTGSGLNPAGTVDATGGTNGIYQFCENDQKDNGMAIMLSHFPENSGNGTQVGRILTSATFSRAASTGDFLFQANMYFRLNVFHRWTAVWLNASQTGVGWGLTIIFVNGVCPNSADFAYSLGDFGAANDALTIPIFLSSGPGNTQSNVDYVQVWQPTSLPTVYAHLSRWDQGTDLVIDKLTNPGLKLTKPSAGGTTWESVRSHSGKTSGKWYWEITVSGGGIASTTGAILGIMNSAADPLTHFPGGTAKGAGLQYNTAANTNVNGVTGDTATSITWAANDVIGFAFDAGAGQVWIHKNGTWITAAPGGADVWSGLSSANGPWYATLSMHDTGNTLVANFGATAFAFTLPAGYSGWTGTMNS